MFCVNRYMNKVKIMNVPAGKWSFATEKVQACGRTCPGDGEVTGES